MWPPVSRIVRDPGQCLGEMGHGTVYARHVGGLPFSLKAPLCIPLGGLPYPPLPPPPTHTPVPGLHTLGQVLARRLLSASLTRTNTVILGSATALGLTGGHLKEALIIPNPLTTRDVLGSPSSGNPVSVIQVTYAL